MCIFLAIRGLLSKYILWYRETVVVRDECSSDANVWAVNLAIEIYKPFEKVLGPGSNLSFFIGNGNFLDAIIVKSKSFVFVVGMLFVIGHTVYTR